VLMQDLNSHSSIEPRIQSLVNLAHSAGANPLDDFVVTQS
jgi:hypothetical protein